MDRAVLPEDRAVVPEVFWYIWYHQNERGHLKNTNSKYNTTNLLQPEDREVVPEVFWSIWYQQNERVHLKNKDSKYNINFLYLRYLYILKQTVVLGSQQTKVSKTAHYTVWICLEIDSYNVCKQGLNVGENQIFSVF